MDLLLILVLVLLGGIGLLTGFYQSLTIAHLTRNRVLAVLFTFAGILMVMGFLFWWGVLTEQIARLITIGFYCLVAGFFLGNGLHILQLRTKAGIAEYINPSPLIKLFPAALTLIIVAFGIYRTGLLTETATTPIGITSGLSLIGFGFYGYMVHIVPEFRRNGILLLDHFIEWDRVLAFRWTGEEVVCVVYERKDGQLSEFCTAVPMEDRRDVEYLLEDHILDDPLAEQENHNEL